MKSARKNRGVSSFIHLTILTEPCKLGETQSLSSLPRLPYPPLVPAPAGSLENYRDRLIILEGIRYLEYEL